MTDPSPLPRRFKFSTKVIEGLPPNPRDSRSTDMEYTDTEVAGLKLLVSKNGRKFFFFRYTYRGVKRATKLGEFGSLGVTEARKLALAIRYRVDQGEDPQAEKVQQRAVPLLRDFALEEYLSHARQHKRTAAWDESKLRIHILPRLGAQRLDAITAREIERYHADIKALRCAATANRHLALLSRLFKLAVQWGRTPRNPCLGIKKFREAGAPIRALAAADVERLIQAMDAEQNPVVAAALKLLLLTGLRKEEVLRAKWEHLDLERATLFLPTTKSGRSRTAVLNAAAVALLQQQSRREGNAYIFPGHIRGQPIINPSKPWRRILAAAGITEHLRIHDLRHHFASVLANEGVSLDIIAQLLGHRSTQTTRIYAHWADSALRRASDVVSTSVTRALQAEAD